MSSHRYATARPQDVGVDPAGLASLVTAAERAGLDLHSLLVLRYGRVCAETYWHPYGPDRIQLLYSLSKTFTSSAVGIAIAEGRFDLDDLVVDLLPGRDRYGLGAGMDRVRVRHLLSMASGHADDTIGAMLSRSDAVAAVLAEPLAAEPGALFTYNQGCTYLLSAVIAEHTGSQLHDYLRPRLFDPLGIGEITWRQTGGLDQGFSGLHARTRDIAALGQLYLDHGRVGDTQVLPAEWVRDATRSHVDNAGRQEHPDWQQGYGFQLWRCRPDCFRGDGAFGQFMIVVPWADLVIATTAQTEQMQELADLFWTHLLPAVDATANRQDHQPAAPDPGPARAWSPEDLAVPPPPPATITPPAGTQSFVVDGDEPYLPVSRIDTRAGGAATTVTVTLRTGEHLDLDVGPAWTGAGWHRLAEAHRPSRTLTNVQVAGGWSAPTRFDFDVIFINAPHRLSVHCDSGRARLRWWTVPL
ncbi:MAG: serine hydrolase domain-containing protein [Actinomycetales bacterium]